MAEEKTIPTVAKTSSRGAGQEARRLGDTPPPRPRHFPRVRRSSAALARPSQTVKPPRSAALRLQTGRQKQQELHHYRRPSALPLTTVFEKLLLR